jgi:hypothetical protein
MFSAHDKERGSEGTIECGGEDMREANMPCSAYRTRTADAANEVIDGGHELCWKYAEFRNLDWCAWTHSRGTPHRSRVLLEEFWD